MLALVSYKTDIIVTELAFKTSYKSIKVKDKGRP